MIINRNLWPWLQTQDVQAFCLWIFGLWLHKSILCLRSSQSANLILQAYSEAKSCQRDEQYQPGKERQLDNLGMARNKEGSRKLVSFISKMSLRQLLLIANLHPSFLTICGEETYSP